VRKFGTIAYLFLYVFILFMCLTFVIIGIVNFLPFQAGICAQWLSMGVLVLEQPSTEF
jgi:hypothetical protein